METAVPGNEALTRGSSRVQIGWRHTIPILSVFFIRCLFLQDSFDPSPEVAHQRLRVTIDIGLDRVVMMHMIVCGERTAGRSTS